MFPDVVIAIPMLLQKAVRLALIGLLGRQQAGQEEAPSY